MSVSNGRKLKAAREIIAVLAERFPVCFAVGRYRQPLKVGIRDEVQAALAISEKEAAFALRVYTNNARYLLACTEDAPRIDLRGEMAGRVTAEEAAHAKQRLQQGIKKAPITTKPEAECARLPVPKPRRLGLADLKAAAMARRRGKAA
jgi:sRNA-binding protein